jgi:hypothetical protein
MESSARWRYDLHLPRLRCSASVAGVALQAFCKSCRGSYGIDICSHYSDFKEAILFMGVSLLEIDGLDRLSKPAV